MLVSVGGYGQKINFNQLGVREGLSNNNIESITQDEFGYLWFATRDGLNRYDGHQITEISLSNDKNEQIKDYTSLYYDLETHQLVCGLYQGAISLLNTTTGEVAYQRLPNSDTHVNQIFGDSNSRIWVGSANGLFIFDLKKLKWLDVDFTQYLKGDFISSVTFIPNREEIWLSNNHSIFIFNDEFSLVDQFDILDENNEDFIKRICHIDQKAFVLFDSEQKILGYDLESKKLKKVIKLPELTLARDILKGENNYWITTTNGFYSIDNKFRKLSKVEGLNHLSLTKIFQDKSGEIWLGSRGSGMISFSQISERFRHFNNKDDKLNTPIVRAIEEDIYKRLWIGTDGGGVNIVSENRRTNYVTEEDGLASNRVRSLRKDHKGRLWVGTTAGLQILATKDGGYTIIDSLSSVLPKGNIWSIIQDQSKHIWVGTSDKLYVYNSDIELVHTYSKENGLPSNDINVVFETTDGDILIGTYGNGMAKFNPKNKTFEAFHLTTDSTDAVIEVTVIHEDSDKNLWVGTHGQGLIKINQQSEVEVFNIQNGFLDDVIYGLVEDTDQRLWYSTNRGIGFLEAKAGKKHLKFFTEKNGLLFSEFNQGAFKRSQSGEIYLGGVNGVIHFKPNSIQENPYQPQPIFTSVEAGKISDGEKSLLVYDNYKASTLDSLSLAHTQNDIQIRFSSMSFVDRKQNRYAYILEPYEETWTNVSEFNVAKYTNLSPGQYQFKLKAFNNDGVSNSEPKVLNIEIRTPYWQTTWFKFLVILSLLVIGVLTMKWRMARLEHKNQVLEEKVLLKTSEILQQKEEIEGQAEVLKEQRDKLSAKSMELEMALDELNLKNNQVVDSIKYAKKIQKTILPSKQKMEDVLGSYFTIYKPKDIVSGDFFWLSEIDEKTFCIAVIDCTGHGVPGAIMSMVGYSLLNRIVNVKKIHAPDKVLELLDKSVKEDLKHDAEKSVKDGMDVSFCKIIKNEASWELYYAGAKMPIFIKEGDSEIYRVSPTNKAIGGHYRKVRPFELKTAFLKKGDRIFLSSDGIIDQSNEDRKKIGTPLFMSWLDASQPLDVQKQSIKDKLVQHQGDFHQRDDITVVGIEVS
ncbi:serine phosphatase RsbU (regulator of sigma subunit) [Sediminitomix flava]|uniref:Serine phosphatase RsbU (Regulator of sigma subunit) n=2 Tax=Sediminitomix flava TaxID=379075 RepID=A0A315ZGK1_SEDFL|nr:serine phosphatase RsbU (regulator of sigma subunit) [Sediminitomix flava]